MSTVSMTGCQYLFRGQTDFRVKAHYQAIRRRQTARHRLPYGPGGARAMAGRGAGGGGIFRRRQLAGAVRFPVAQEPEVGLGFRRVAMAAGFKLWKVNSTAFEQVACPGFREELAGARGGGTFVERSCLIAGSRHCLRRGEGGDDEGAGTHGFPLLKKALISSESFCQ